jgi:4-hydroxy-3-methylbut-2-enyl diphosphate reductase
MNVILAKSSGFCFGVKRAMDMALETGERAPRSHSVFTDGPLIHNQQALDLLHHHGVAPLEELAESSGSDTIIVRSHGITPERRRQLEETGARVLDATCPRVQKVQSIIKEHAEKGFFVVIVGEAHHAEVEGLLGYAGDAGTAIQRLEELPDLDPGTKVCLVAQTTQSREHFLRLAERITDRFPHAEVFDTICNANRRRQEELLQLCPRVDAVVVAGGRQSGNTKRLFEIARETDVPTFFAETSADLDRVELRKYGTVGVIGGASTPAWILEDIVAELEKM